ncbi:unnamed protein product [Owenia fusiformis]|uniref:Uncharacterized protein n=1 Tax=Owenia fusiformis TaxID=6347 RepID=A0A8J1TU50_OWEFU|nr:unnamed protein product [Owenia fusiformis]
MAHHSELRVLKEEEKVLTNLSRKLADQLNRLKVEELTILFKIRERDNKETGLEETKKDQEQDATVQKEDADDLDVNIQPLLDLDLGPTGDRYQDEEEEEEEDDMDTEMEENNQLTYMFNTDMTE